MMKIQDEPHYHGHRERLKERFKTHSETALADYELLELMLFRAIPRKDVKPIAKALLERFGTFAEVLSAPLPRLMDINGIGEAVALEIKIYEAAAKRFSRSMIRQKKSFKSIEEIADYCCSAIGYSEIEQFLIIFLDKNNALIADEIQQRGTVDHTPVYPREIVKRALELSATALVLAHNHPSGVTQPSHADIALTKEIDHICHSLGILVHDHLIVGKSGYNSLKALNAF